MTTEYDKLITENFTKEEIQEVEEMLEFLEVINKLTKDSSNKSQPLVVGDEIILTINRGNGQIASHKGKIVEDCGSHWLIEFADVSGKYDTMTIPNRELIAKRSRKTELRRS